jgi:hypothetical protein
MANQNHPRNFYGSIPGEDEMRSRRLLEAEVQPDPERTKGHSTGGRIVVFGLAIAAFLGAMFYVLNDTALNPNRTVTVQTIPASEDAAQTTPPPIPPGVRDVTPHHNNELGTTTGAVPARPQQPPEAAPSGADLNRSGNPSTTDNSSVTK